MGKSKELATGAAYVDASGDTMTGALVVSAAETNDIIKLERTGSYAGSGYIYANQNQTFGVKTGAGQYQLMVDTAGRVTMPYQSFFDGQFSNSGFMAADSLNTISQTSNSGITLGNNNTRLTVPVEGYYFVHAAQLAYPQNADYGYFSIMVNGQLKYHSHNNFYTENNKDFTATKVLYLGAYDYIEFKWSYKAMASTWSGTHSTVSVYKLG